MRGVLKGCAAEVDVAAGGLREGFDWVAALGETVFCKYEDVESDLRRSGRARGSRVGASILLVWKVGCEERNGYC